MRNWIRTTIAIAIVLGGAIGAVILTLKQLRFQGIEATSYPDEVPNSSVNAIAVKPQQLAQQWIVSPAEAKYLIEQGAIVLDVRDRSVQKRGTLKGAISVRWQQFSQSQNPHRGNLLEDEAELTQQLRNVGVSTNQTVVVIGDPLRGWGEDGRVVWMLRTLGHRQAVFVDGGYAALIKTGLPQARDIAQTADKPGDFIIRRRGNWEITQTALKVESAEKIRVVLDTREPREFEGATPYGERRGGRIPGAVLLHYKELMDAEGRILPGDAILALLRDRGIPLNAVIVSYCTGGVRSGWVTSVLVNLGLQAQNYAGSMWEWSAGDPTHYPLVTD